MENNSSLSGEPLVTPVEDLIREMREEMARQSALVAKLLAERESLQEAVVEAKSAPAIRHSSDPNLNFSRQSAARSATILTRPVQDDPSAFAGVVGATLRPHD